jgi:hypothetical protein
MLLENKIKLIQNSFGKSQTYRLEQTEAMRLYDALLTVAMEQDKNLEKDTVGTVVSFNKGFVITRPFQGMFTIHISGSLKADAVDQLVGIFNDAFMSMLLVNDF